MSDPAENTEFNAETLTGDVRDFLLSHLRDMAKPWQQMSEAEQRAKVAITEKHAEFIAKKAVNIVASRDFDRVSVKVGKFTVKDGSIKAEFTCVATHDNLLSISDADFAVLVLADPDEFHGERAAAAVDPDEPDLPIDDDGIDPDDEPDDGAPEDDDGSSGEAMPDIPPDFDRRPAPAPAG